MAYRIGRLAELSGFPGTLLRAWERRYDLLHPQRLENGYRLYTDEDLALLHRVRGLLDEGRSIGDIVRLFDKERAGTPPSEVVDMFDGRHPEISWAILEAIPYAVIVTDVQGRVRWANRGVPALCGYDLAELRGRTPGSILQRPGSKPEAVARLRAGVAERRWARAEVLNKHKSGEPYLADVEIVPMQSGLEVVGFVGMVRRVDE